MNVDVQQRALMSVEYAIEIVQYLVPQKSYILLRALRDQTRRGSGSGWKLQRDSSRLRVLTTEALPIVDIMSTHPLNQD
jgi:hypothetical protein